jgi:hypothetical protein
MKVDKAQSTDASLATMYYSASRRNDPFVKDVVTLKDERLYWNITEEIKADEPEGDSPLVLPKGILRRINK